MSRFEDNRLFVLNDSHAPRLSPALAEEIGLNESILLLQLEFLIAVRGTPLEGRRWVRMSVRDLEREFPFWSYSTVNRAVQSLEGRGLITVENFNERKYDKTRWFSINLDEAAGLRSIAVKQAHGASSGPPAPEASAAGGGGVETRSTQNETGSAQDETRSTQNETAIDRELNPETKPESTRTPPPGPPVKQAGGVCVLSRHTYEQRRAYARNQPQIDNPEGFAMSRRAVAGEFDEAIARWQAEVERPAGARPERDVSGCPDCYGTGMFYPEGPAKGVARCRHERLAEQEAEAVAEAVPP